MRSLAAAALLLGAPAAFAAANNCKIADGAEACRSGLIEALRADPPDFLMVLGAAPGACKVRGQGAAALFHALPPNADRKIILSGLNPHRATDLNRRAVDECRGLPGAKANSEAELMCAYIRMLPA